MVTKRNKVVTNDFPFNFQIYFFNVMYTFTSRISRPCDEKGKARAFVDNRKDRRKKKQRSSKNKNTRRYSSLAGKKHCGDVCGCKRSRKVEGHDRLRLQQTRQLMMTHLQRQMRLKN